MPSRSGTAIHQSGRGGLSNSDVPPPSLSSHAETGGENDHREQVFCSGLISEVAPRAHGVQFGHG